MVRPKSQDPKVAAGIGVRQSVLEKMILVGSKYPQYSRSQLFEMVIEAFCDQEIKKHNLKLK